MNTSENHVIFTKIPFAVAEQGLFAVPTQWGWDLEAYLPFFSKIIVVAPKLPFNRSRFPFILNYDNISFCGVPGFINTRGFLWNLPRLVGIICVQMANWDILHCSGEIGTPIGIVAHIVGVLKNKKRIFIIDADVVSDIEIKSKTRNMIKRIFLFLAKGFFLCLLKFCITTSHLTIVVGRGLYERYTGGNVVEIFASWVKRKDMISLAEFNTKVKNILEKKEIQLIFASSLTSKKGAIYAIQAAAILKARGIPFILDVYGSGPRKNELENYVKTHGLSESVFFRGTVPYGESFYRMLRKGDIILIPNLSEELPRIVFDALASGLAVVASRTRAINAVISKDGKGLLVAPRAPEELASAVQTLHEYREKWVGNITRGLEYMQNHTIETMHQKIADAISEAFE